MARHKPEPVLVKERPEAIPTTIPHYKFQEVCYNRNSYRVTTHYYETAYIPVSEVEKGDKNAVESYNKAKKDKNSKLEVVDLHTCWLCAQPETKDVVERNGKEKIVVTLYVKDSTKCTVLKPEGQGGKVYGSVHVCNRCLDRIGGLTEASAAKVSFAKFHKAWSDHDKLHPPKPKASNLSQKKPAKRKVGK